MKLCAVIFGGGWVGGPGPSLPEHTTGGGGWVVCAKESHVCPWPVKRPHLGAERLLELLHERCMVLGSGGNVMNSTRPLQGLAEVSCNLNHLGCELARAYACALACTCRAHADYRNPEKQPSQTCNPTTTKACRGAMRVRFEIKSSILGVKSTDLYSLVAGRPSWMNRSARPLRRCRFSSCKWERKVN